MQRRHPAPRQASAGHPPARRRSGSSTPRSITRCPRPRSQLIPIAHTSRHCWHRRRRPSTAFEATAHLQLDKITTSAPESIDFVVTVNGKNEQQVNTAVAARGLMGSFHLQPAGSTPATTTLAPVPEPSVPRMRPIPTGVGSPPLKGALTLLPGKRPFSPSSSSPPRVRTTRRSRAGRTGRSLTSPPASPLGVPLFPRRSTASQLPGRRNGLVKIGVTWWCHDRRPTARRLQWFCAHREVELG